MLLLLAYMAASSAALQAPLIQTRVPPRIAMNLAATQAAAQVAPFHAAVDLCMQRVYSREHVSLESVPTLMRETCEADFQTALERCERTILANVTCLCPKEDVDGNFLYNDELVSFQAAHTRVGRKCRGGACSSACSRVLLADLASAGECEALRQHAGALMARYGSRPLGQSPFLEEEVAGKETTLDLPALARSGDVRATLLFLRLLERLRRSIAHEYGLPLRSVDAVSGYVVRIVAGAAPKSYGLIHADESSSDEFHYSGLLYLQSQGDGFTGGDFVFSDPPRGDLTDASSKGVKGEERAARETDAVGRSLTRLSPLRGRALIFSSGFENIHYVDELQSGERFALAAFFRTTEAAVAGAEQDQEDPAGADYSPLRADDGRWTEDVGAACKLWEELTS